MLINVIYFISMPRITRTKETGQMIDLQVFSYLVL